MPGGALPFAMPDFQASLNALMEAGAEASRWMAAGNALAGTIMARGYPSFAGGIAEAPFDIIGDSFRGTRGVLLDMHRRPGKLLEACDVFVRSTVKRGVSAGLASGNPLIFMPLHKGADAFMSREQYREFYWPSLRKVLVGLINEGMVPLIFAEADYESRLDIISDLPKGKVIWWFEKIDMARAKEVLGKAACIAGNVPNALFRAGPAEDIKACCRNLIDVAGKDGGFILSTAAGLQGAKPENVKALIDFSKEYGVYS
jgi:uroporphyrinogen-III decarboxylase